MKEVHTVSWNVRRLADPIKITIVRNWQHRQTPLLAIICLQELQTNKHMVDFQMANLVPQSLVTSNSEDRVGSAIVDSPQSMY